MSYSTPAAPRRCAIDSAYWKGCWETRCMNFACTHVENPSLRALRMIARIGCPALRCASSASSKRSCHGLAMSGTAIRSSERIVAQWRAQNGVSNSSRSRASCRSGSSFTKPMKRDGPDTGGARAT
jgi:hypothetical protein